MDFTRTVMFLGLKRAYTKDGSVAFNVDIYVPGGDHWQFYVKDTKDNKTMLDKLMRAQTGHMVDASFTVRRWNDGKTSLILVGVEDAA